MRDSDDQGFPPQTYRIRYASPGETAQAARAVSLLREAGLHIKLARRLCLTLHPLGGVIEKRRTAVRQFWRRRPPLALRGDLRVLRSPRRGADRLRRGPARH